MVQNRPSLIRFPLAVPADLLPECIWACERFVDAVNMSTLEGVQVMTPDLLPTGSTDEAGKKIIGPDLRYLLVNISLYVRCSCPF